MRIKNVSGYTIEYLNDIAWLYDSNKIKISGSTAGFNVKILVQNPDGDQNQLEYTTRTKTITFILDDNLKYLWSKGNGDWSYTIFIDDSQLFSFGTKVLNGKSFLNKTHGSSDVLYLYDINTVYDSRYIEIYAPNDGRLVCNGVSYNVNYGWNRIYILNLGISQTGDYDILLTDRNADSITAFVVSDFAKKPPISTIKWDYQLQSHETIIWGGTLFEREKYIFPMTFKFHYEDLCPSDVVLRYTNQDGCLRHISGKLLEEKDEFEPTRLNNVVRSEQYKFNPTFTNNNNSKTLKIGLYDIEAGAEINDIIFSDTLQILDIDNEWRDCVLKTNTVTNYKNNGFENIEFEVIISEL